MCNIRVLGVDALFRFVKIPVRTLIWQPQQLSNCWLSFFVEWPRRMWWESLLGESEREITEKQRLSEREWERRRRSKGQGQEREGEGGQEGASWCESASDHLVLLLHPLALYLSVPPFLSFPLKFLSWRFALLWRPVSIDDNGGDASVEAHASACACSRCQCELKLKLRCTRPQSETQTNTVTHSRGLWANPPRRA